jgi:serine/threonine protein kinase
MFLVQEVLKACFAEFREEVVVQKNDKCMFFMFLPNRRAMIQHGIIEETDPERSFVGKGSFSEVTLYYDSDGRKYAYKNIASDDTTYELMIVSHLERSSLGQLLIPETKFLIMGEEKGILMRCMTTSLLLIPRETLSRDFLIIVRQILRSLCTWTYSCGLSHGDVKPANIVYEDGCVKIIDWALASINNFQSDDYKRYTKEYRAPELLKGRIPRTYVMSDIWATACTILALVCYLEKYDYPFLKWRAVDDYTHACNRCTCIGTYFERVDPDLRDLLLKMLVVDEKARIGIRDIG